jgi:hypothetical protein
MVVLCGVTEVTIEAWDAQGDTDSNGGQSGLGAHVTGTFAVTRGETLLICVGGQGMLLCTYPWPKNRG